MREHAVPGAWPRADQRDRARMAEVLGSVPDGSLLLVDGLVAADAPEVLVPAAARLRLVVLLHMPRLPDPESPTGSAQCSRRLPPWSRPATRPAGFSWAATASTRGRSMSRSRVSTRHPWPRVPRPAGRCSASPPSRPARATTCCSTALADLRDLAWRCLCVGSLTRDPGWAARMLRQCSDGRTRRPRRLPGRPQSAPAGGVVRRRGRAGAGDPVRELRHGRRRGARPRDPGHRERRRRAPRRRSAARRTAACRGCWCPQATPRPWRARCGAGSRTTGYAATCARPPGSAARSLPAGPRPPTGSTPSWRGWRRGWRR